MSTSLSPALRRFSVCILLVGALTALGTVPNTSASDTSAPTRRARPPAASWHTPPVTMTGLLTGTLPINDLGAGTYLGFEGGLYPGGSNTIPPAHLSAGIARANSIGPLDTNGNPSSSGKFVLLSIGMSNATQEWCTQDLPPPNCDTWTFTGQAISDTSVNHNTLVIANGAAGGQTAEYWISPTQLNYTRVLTQVLEPQGLSEQQVVAVWLKEADGDPGPNGIPSLPAGNADAYVLSHELAEIARAAKVCYPHLQLVFASSRIYGGYATVKQLNPEPYAYESGFAVKWLIEAQINQMASGVIDPNYGDLNYNTVAPLIVWGPYLWANGTIPRSDGLTWLVSDFEADGTHPSTSGETKVGTMLLDFFTTSPMSQPWFMASYSKPGPQLFLPLVVQ